MQLEKLRSEFLEHALLMQGFEVVPKYVEANLSMRKFELGNNESFVLWSIGQCVYNSQKEFGSAVTLQIAAAGKDLYRNLLMDGLDVVEGSSSTP